MDKRQFWNNFAGWRQSMLVNFSVENFLSFKERQTLDLEADSLKELPENLLTPYLYNHNEKLLKAIAIYGHNSYGKTNFFKAFTFFQQFIFTSFTAGQTQNTIDVEPFRFNTSTVNKPSLFEITFLVKEVKYRYRCQISSEKIIEERLFYAEAGIRENYLFEREFQNIKVSKTWNKEANSKVEQAIAFTKPHILFLSVLFSQEEIPRVESIATWFKAHLIIPDDYLLMTRNARRIYSDLNYRSLILKFIESADLGFTTIYDKIDQTPQNNLQLEKGVLQMWYDKQISELELFTTHVIYDENNTPVDKVEFPLEKKESAGSIKYFIIVCMLSHAIKNSNIIWIDELDARLDSSLLEMLVKSFHDSKINPINSQLIFTTHNTVLLDKKLRRDQMVVVEKNTRGESKLERMHSSRKPIRIGKSIEKEYRSGTLGGVSKKIKQNNNQISLDFE